MPADPYVGLQGIVAAWARFQYWIHTDLPREWDELAALLGEAQGSTVQTPPPPPPTPLPPPSPPPPPPALPPGITWPLSAYDPSQFSATDQATIRALAQNWSALWRYQTYSMDTNEGFTGAPDVGTAAAIAIGADVMVIQPRAWICPPGQGQALFPAAHLWVYGEELTP